MFILKHLSYLDSNLLKKKKYIFLQASSVEELNVQLQWFTERVPNTVDVI